MPTVDIKRPPAVSLKEIQEVVGDEMLTGKTIAGKNYLPFNELPGIKESVHFQRCALALLVQYVDILVFQDGWRLGQPSASAAASPRDTPLPVITKQDIDREFSILNAAANRLIKRFDEVSEAYRAAQPEERWKESLLGALVSLALKAKVRITQIPKISQDASRFVGADIPPWATPAEAAREYLKSASPSSFKDEPPSGDKNIKALRLTEEVLDALVEKIVTAAQHKAQ